MKGPKTLRLLLAEDYDDDALLVLNALERQGFEIDCTRVMTGGQFRTALQASPYEIILCDYAMPGFGAIEALEILRECDIDIPLIIVSGTIGESVAVEAMRNGATDYILKENLIRLGVAVEREIREAETRRQKRLIDSFSIGQTEVLEMILNRESLTVILERIIERVELLSSGKVQCTIMLVNSEGTHLNLGAGPSMPAAFLELLDSVPVEVGMGACGTAAALGETTIIEDISTHPYWASVSEIAESCGFRACWSIPVFSSDRRVLGTMSVYHQTIHSPTSEEIHWVESASKLVSLAIERGRAAEKLHQSETLFRIASDAARIGGWTVDFPENRITWSDQICAIHEMPVGTVPNLPQALRFYAPEWRDKITEVFEKCRVEGIPFDEELQINTANGRRIWVRSIGEAIRDEQGFINRIQGAFQDITDRKQAEQAEETTRSNELRYLEQRNALISLNGNSSSNSRDFPSALRRITEASARTLDVARVSIWKYTEDRKFIECLDQFVLAGEEHSAGVRLAVENYPNYFDILNRLDLIAADDALTDPGTCEFSGSYLIPNGITSMLDVPIRFGNETSYLLCNEHCGPMRHWTSDEKTFAIAIANLISLAIESNERACAQQEVLQSHQRFQSVAAATNDTIWDWNLETDAFWWYDGFANLYGGSAADSEASIRVWIRQIHHEDRDRVVRGIYAAIGKGDTHWTDEYRFISNSGSVAHVRDRGQILRDAGGQAIRMVGGMTDLTSQKAAELELTRSHRALLMLSSCNEMLVRATSEMALLTEACRLAVEIGGYQMAWVGYAMDDENRSVVPVAHAGRELGYLSEIEVSWAEDRPSGRGPAGKAIRGGEAILVGDLESDPSFASWAEAALKRGFRSVVTLPLRNKDRAFGAVSLLSGELHPASGDEMKMLRQMANDLAFGIENIRSRQERQRTQDVVIKVAQAVSSGMGSEFFDLLTRNMVEAMDALGGLIGRYNSVGNSIDTISFFFDGKPMDNVSYGLDGTPCESVAGGDICVFESGIQKLFPDDHLLVLFGIEAYAGIPLFQRDGSVAGIMVVFFASPLKETSLVKSTLRIFATRAASELDRQQADARIREQASLLDKAQDAILVRNLDNKITYWNKSAERIYGWPAEEVLGRCVLDVLYQDAAAFRKAHEHTLLHGEWMGEIMQVDSAGQELTIEGRWTLVRDDQGNPESVFALNTDITEQRKLEQQFLRAQRIESIGTLAGGIAHDLNNILAPISMAIELLKMRVTDARSGELLDTIASSAKRGADMVGQVLSFARGMEGRHVEVHPLQIIREIESIMRDTFLRKIELEVTASRELWVIHGDPTQLHQVILNLCVNARDAVEDGGKIIITAGNVEIDETFAAMNLEAEKGPHVFIQVEDSGVGIPANIMDRIFDPFFTTKSVGKGTGLGLSTSLAIIKSHGGFIRAFSKPGEGSRFRIYLPAYPEISRNLPNLERPALPQGSGETVLVVDDEESIREITRQTLEAFGYRVLLASNGDEAISIYSAHQFDIHVVLTDMMMPVMDGLATIELLMEINPLVKIIATSGINANKDLVSAVGKGAANFLQKPYTAEVLLKCLKQVTGDEVAVG
ncbi:MAG: GAF domain-containing protein [Luteolibacter sp.]|uniref:GAF domain-containing protein n=1 Tax=Luteolibacter sp. TaxID=1962973 RepID=UPI003266DFBF